MKIINLPKADVEAGRGWQDEGQYGNELRRQLVQPKLQIREPH